MRKKRSNAALDQHKPINRSGDDIVYRIGKAMDGASLIVDDLVFPSCRWHVYLADPVHDDGADLNRIRKMLTPEQVAKLQQARDLIDEVREEFKRDHHSEHEEELR